MVWRTVLSSESLVSTDGPLLTEHFPCIGSVGALLRYCRDNKLLNTFLTVQGCTCFLSAAAVLMDIKRNV